MQEEKKDLNTKSEAALREEKVLEFWKENQIFEKSEKQREGKKEFVFYEGPPTANGNPGIHHLEARAFKDAIPRYKTMRGYHLRRKGGWDTHGLPVELQVEKKLGLNSKKAIEEYGVAKFNQECKNNVWELLDKWTHFTERMGYWTDLKNPYVTYHNTFIESVWNIVKEVSKQNLLYKDYKVVPWCPRCGTALSSHELAQGYEDVKDLSLYVKFKIVGAENGYFMAWTTTPWTLPGNVGLAVGPDIDYVEAKVGGEILVLAKEKLSLLEPGYEIIAEHKGREMAGMQYEPLFPYLANNITESEKPKLANAFKVYLADFVTTTDGTGIVHTAVMYGQEDFELGTKVGLPKLHLVNLEGKFVAGTDFLEGRFVKEKNEDGKPTLDVDIINYLTAKNLFFKKENYTHSYPHCWRCKTALIYYARDSWYIRMSDPKVKAELISENQKINWEPSHIRDGRFGEWLREIKDWAISRERYWGTPLPVWQCNTCQKVEVVGSIEQLKEKTKKSSNQYFVMRHGEAQSNVKKIIDSRGDRHNTLTETGKKEAKNSAEKYKNEGFDFIFCSPMLRTRETAGIVAETIGFNKNKIVFDDRLIELQVGDLDGKNIDEFFKYINSVSDYSSATALPSGESQLDVYKRIGAFLYELETKYANKKILIVSHGDPTRVLFVQAKGFTKDKIEDGEKDFKYFHTGEIRKLDFVPLPHNENYELDLHKPYIDNVKLGCAHSTNSGQACGGDLVRTKEVMDVWFDSGAMPFAQDHYPFENKKFVDGPGFPADYISEAIDQTRGWFYTLHAIGVLMGRGRAYKNVICLGHLLDANGKKMSKSLGNVVDPWSMMDKYGVDTLRMWMYSVNQPGESKNFDEKTVALLQQQVFTLLYNVLAFYELYRDKEVESNEWPKSYPKSKNILDRWILDQLFYLTLTCTNKMDEYKLLEPVRAIRDFIGDLSTWYLRRSRERIKDGDKDAKATLYFVLKNLIKLMAPFAPFTAEDIWSRLKIDGDKESVHLADWPETRSFSSLAIESNMEQVRKIVTLGLEARQKSKIPVRQSLSKLEVKNLNINVGRFFFFKEHFKIEDYLELIKDELNVKEIVENPNIENEVNLDTNITPALKAEGEYREFVRELQERRKKLGLNPSDKMEMTITEIYKKYKLPENLQQHMFRVAAVASMICDNFNGTLDKENIISACLLHDMGNIVKFKLDVFPEFLEPEGLEYWQGVQYEYTSKYGSNDHDASLAVVKEIGVSERIFALTDAPSFIGAPHNAESDDFGMKIVDYSDVRVYPHGVVSIEERFADLRKRYVQHGPDTPERTAFENALREIQTQIFTKCKIKPEDITDASIAPIMEDLRGFVIK